MEAVNNFAEQLEGIPGYDMAVDWINDKAGDKYQTKDPYYVEIHGKKKRRKAPESCTKEEQKSWKKIKKRAWFDDRNFFGCYPLDLGLGMAPLAALIPVFGPLLMFAIHGRLVTIADQELHLPPATVAKMHANILFDLLISLPPIIGSFFSWMNACSTRNAAMVHTFLVKKEAQKEQEKQRILQANIQQNQRPPQQPGQKQPYTPQKPQQQHLPQSYQKQSPEVQRPQQAYDATRRGRQM